MHPRSEHDGDGPCAACLPDPDEHIRLQRRVAELERPIPMLLWCPECGKRHVDKALASKPHHTHACQHCGFCWRPALVATVGVQFLPGFKDED